MKYKPERDLPEFARETKTLSPTKLAEIVLNRRNREITPESVTMWFKRHQTVYDDLSKELIQGLPTETQSVETSIFSNGNFRELPSVKNWIIMMSNREVSETVINQQLNTLRLICQGKIHEHDLVNEGKWCLKHPDRLMLKEAMECITLIKDLGFDPNRYKHVLKDFLESKDVTVGKKIAVGKPRGYGKFAKLHVEKEVCARMLDDLKTTNLEAYIVDRFMWETGTRINASLAAKIDNIKVVGDKAIITVYDKGRRSKYPEGHPWDKYVSSELLALIKQHVGDRTSGNIFSINDSEMGELNRKLIQVYCPKTLEKYPDLMPNHFWRHMFAQHLLRQSEWNYAVVASLGGWTIQALQESYGQPPEELVEEWSAKFQLVIPSEVKA